MPSFKESFQGKLILDSGKLAGSYFDRAVILICRHDESGCLGLVLNRPLKQALGSLVQNPLADKLARIPLYMGGPVQPKTLSFLQQTDFRPEFEILPWLVFGHSIKELKEPSQLSGLRVFAGYAGWNPGQLEDEMKMGCWITHPSLVSLVFYPKPETLWRDVLQKKGVLYRLIVECPDNPALN